jgi:hypothetical protein
MIGNLFNILLNIQLKKHDEKNNFLFNLQFPNCDQFILCWQYFQPGENITFVFYQS